MAMLSSDIYEIQSYNEELLKTNIDEDESTLALGMFGYLEDSFSHIMQNEIIVSSEYINEMFPTRVKYEKSIMDYAMLYNINNVNATPSTMNVMLCLVETDIEKVLRTKTDEEFIIDRNQPFYFGEYEFHLEYDISLKRSRLLDNTIIYTAIYNDGVKNPISKIISPYLSTPYRQTINGFRYVFVNCIVRQVTYSEIYKKIITSNPITNKSLEFEFEDQLSSFSVRIKQGDEEFNVTPLLDGSSNVGYDKYCYYRYINSTTIRVLFDSNSYVPRLNDEISIFVQSTKGSEGNFEYTEDVVTSLSSETYGYNNLALLIKPITEAKYGEDKTTVDELKKIIPREALSRGSITTTTDLYNYFNTMNTDDSKLTFIKNIDNQFERLYYAYLLVKNDSGEIIPTNTIDINLLYHDSSNEEKIEFDSNVNNRYIIKPGNHFKYIKSDSGRWIGKRILPDDIDYLENYLDGSTSNDFIYCNPFLIVVNTKPLLYISYFFTILNKTYPLLTNKDNINTKSDLQFIAVSCDWKRGYKEYSYKLSFQCTQNINEDRGMIVKDETTKQPKLNDDESYKTKLRSILVIGDYSGNTTNNSNNCFIEGTLTNYSEENGLFAFQFDFEISTEDKIDEKDRMEVYDVYKSGGSLDGSIINLSNVKEKIEEADAKGEYSLLTETANTDRRTWTKVVDDGTYKMILTDLGWEGIKQEKSSGNEILLDLFDATIDQEKVAENEIPSIITVGGKVFLKERIDIVAAYGNYINFEDIDSHSTWVQQTDSLNKFNLTHIKETNEWVLSQGDIESAGVYEFDMEQTSTANLKSIENMRIFILYEDTTVKEDAPLTKELKKNIVPSSYPIPLNNYVVSSVYQVNGYDGVEIFFNYTDIISSKVTVNQEIGSGGNFKQYLYINSIPMVRAAYLDEDGFHSEELADIIETKRGYIEHLLSLLEDQFGIDFKFYNTYGPSRIFYIDNELIDRVDIKLTFEVALKPGADRANIILIKDDIKKYIENLNNTDFNIHMSNIITDITNKYNVDTIQYIEFSSINGNPTHRQFLSRIPSDQLSINTPPEFINIHNIYTQENDKLVSNGIAITINVLV